ncbi:MAG: formate acetyltransferase [Chloroflexi bacterium]|nr:formate acetyltransferase [Chloroflexota bacterium]
MSQTLTDECLLERLEALRAEKLAQTCAKQELIGAMDHDDWALILPPEASRKVVKAMGPSGLPITDVLVDGFEPAPNHPNGAFYGARACGENFGALMRQHPPYVDPRSSLAGGYMVNFGSYRKSGWKPENDYSHLHERQKRYQLITGIGAGQHFCQDLTIGLEQGWGGILARITHYRRVNPSSAEFYDGLEAVVIGLQDWITRTAEHAEALAVSEPDELLAQNLREMAGINRKLVSEPPSTFREACQWILWFQITARMYNGSGSLGRLDYILQPFYDRDVIAGHLNDEQAIFHLACLLLRDTSYIQLGGPDETGRDVSSPLSYLVLEAAHRLRIPANVAVAVGEHGDDGLLRRGIEVLFSDRTGIPKFVNVERIAEDFARNGIPIEIARQRAYAGCHWFALPGREYTINDCVKINLAAVFDVALRDMLAREPNPSLDALWAAYRDHLECAVATIAEGLDMHMAHQHETFPELVIDLLCHGTIERGLDASYGGVEYVNLGVDAAALATVADSFAAIDQRIEREGRITWQQLLADLDSDWGLPEGERHRLMMRSIPRYGTGGSLADDWAVRVSQLFSELIKAKPTPQGFNMIPGIFSWANTIPMGAALGATPNGRHKGAPISHGANPDPGFRQDGAPSAMATAIAAVQPAWGNSAPMQIELDPALARDEGGVERVAELIATHMRLGGTQVNINIMDKEEVLQAHMAPEKYPDLVVRVTGFSAYFASLSPKFRQLVVDRIIAE